MTSNERSFPWDDHNGDREYSSDEFAEFFSTLFKPGIVATANFGSGLQITESASLGMRVKFGAGEAFSSFGRNYVHDKDEEVTVPIASTLQDRTDSVAIQFNKSQREAFFVYKESDVTVTRTDSIFELQIAKILVPKNSTQITNANITDMRANESVCGYFSPHGKLNAGDITAQFKSELEANGILFSQWFENIKGQLSEDAAGNLQNQINTSIHDGGEIPEGTDLNEFVNPGFYFSAGLVPDSTITNLPLEVTAAFWGQVINYKNEKTGAFRQVIFDNDSGAEYQRSSNGANTSGWGEWQKFITANKDGVVNIKDLEVTGKITQSISASISFPIGYGASVNARRTGNLVEILFSGQTSTQMSGGTTMNEKIPEGFRPADVTSIDFLSPGKHLDTYYYFNPDGTITYQGETLTAKSFLRGVRTYFTNDPWPAET